MKSKTLREDRTAAEWKSVAKRRRSGDPASRILFDSMLRIVLVNLRMGIIIE